MSQPLKVHFIVFGVSANPVDQQTALCIDDNYQQTKIIAAYVENNPIVGKKTSAGK
jgi:hypothetical protein